MTYDLPGFGEIDPQPGQDLNSSALDMLHLANALDFPDKFLVVGYSGGGMHAWSALRYIPDRIAGTYLSCFSFLLGLETLWLHFGLYLFRWTLSTEVL
jgi:pimeloyl-ACP methyl ester carboxylesterase